MNLHFRELILDDLPKIKELSDSMGMLNDPKISDTAGALIKDPRCILYLPALKAVTGVCSTTNLELVRS